jgi:hypothetical protein
MTLATGEAFQRPPSRRWLSTVETLDIDTERFRWMSEEYHRICIARPFVNRCITALAVCSRGFDMPAAEIRAKSGNRALGELRQKLMAFSRVVSLDTDIVNPWSGIAKQFDRKHSTVVCAVYRYGDAIQQAIKP